MMWGGMTIGFSLPRVNFRVTSLQFLWSKEALYYIGSGSPTGKETELSIGQFRVARSTPTHQLIDPTQRNPLQVGKFGPNPTRPNITNNLTV